MCQARSPDALYDDPRIGARLFFPRHDRRLPAVPGGAAVELVLDEGTALGGFWVRAVPRAPTLLYLHGDAENIGDQLYRWPALARAAGLNAFFLDYPGFSTSGGWPSLGGARLAARLALRFLLRQPATRVPAVIVMGRSLGSVFALDLAAWARSPRLRGLVLESGLWDLAAHVAAVADLDAPGLDRERCLAQLARDFDPVRAFARVRCRVLVLHAVDDAVLPVANARALAQAAGQRLWRLQLLDGGGHNAVLPRHRQCYATLLGQLARG